MQSSSCMTLINLQHMRSMPLIIKKTLLFYYPCCRPRVSDFGLFTDLPFSVQSLLCALISLIFKPNSFATNLPVWLRVRGAWM